MQQLTLQFEGFAGSAQPVDVAATTRRRVNGNTVLSRMKDLWSSARGPLVFCQKTIGVVMEDLRCSALAHKEQLEDMAQGAAVMTASLIVILMAAVLQGGAA